MKSIFKISGMHCVSCEELITMELSDLAGVSDIQVDFKTGRASVKLNGVVCKPAKIIEAIKGLGYQAELLQEAK